MQYNKLNCSLNLPDEKVSLFHEFLSQTAKLENFSISPINGDCSNRVYYRVVLNDKTLILMDSSIEMKSYSSFISVGNWLRTHNLRAPEIFAANDSNGLMLIEDFGSSNLNHYLASNPDQEFFLYCKAIDVLVDLHSITPSIQLEKYTGEVLNKELFRLFINYYMPLCMDSSLVEQASKQLFAIFDNLYKVTTLSKQTVVLRDYHAENLMVMPCGKTLGIIDFQDAVLGHPSYDLHSLLEDARRDVSRQLSAQCINYYHSKAQVDDANLFEKSYMVLSAQRNIRLVAFFHKLSHDGKINYHACLPRVVKYLKTTLKHPYLSELAAWVEKYNILSDKLVK